MEITLKALKHSPSLSEETYAFTANIYADGKLVGHASNRGHGGDTNCVAAVNKRDEFQKVIDFCLSLPEKDYGDFSLKSDIERVVDDLVDDFMEAKERKSFENKMKKDMLTGIVYQTKNETNSYSIIKFKMTIEQLLLNPKGVEALKKHVKEAKAKSKGTKILNTNFPKSILSSK